MIKCNKGENIKMSRNCVECGEKFKVESDLSDLCRDCVVLLSRKMAGQITAGKIISNVIGTCDVNMWDNLSNNRL